MSTYHRKDQDEERILEQLFALIEQDEAKTQILNPRRMQQFKYCADTMEALFGRDALEFTAVPHDLYPSCGTITVLAKNLTIRNPEQFTLAAAYASNFEVYPKLDGKLVLAFTFYGLTNKLEG